jgi:hypothetical protein
LCQTQGQEDAGESCDAENFVHDVSLGDCSLGRGTTLRCAPHVYAEVMPV